MPDILMTRSGCDAHLVEGVDDALGDGVVAAAGAQRGLAAAIVEHGESDAVRLRLRACGACVVAIYLPSWEMISSVMERASIGSPL